MPKVLIPRQYKATRPKKESDNAKRVELVNKALRGDKTALGELMHSIAKSVLFRTRYLLRTQMDAEDAAQEILMRVCANIRGLQDPQTFDAWLNSIVLNETRRYMAKNYKNKDETDITDYLDDLREENGDFIPQEFAEKEEHRRIILEIISALPDRQREAILLYYYDDLSVIDIASAMEVKQPAVSLYLKLAREKIRQELESRLKDYPELLNGILALPCGTLVCDVLSAEAAVISLNSAAWLQAETAHCISLAGSAKAGVAEAAVIKNAFAVKQLLVPALGIAAAATAATVGVISANNYWNAEPDYSQPPAIVQYVPAQASGGIIFTGGDENQEHVNPLHATAWADNGVDTLTIHEWWITGTASEDRLFYGRDAVDSTLALMQQDGMGGHYMLCIAFENETGEVLYVVSRQFEIRSINTG